MLAGSAKSERSCKKGFLIDYPTWGTQHKTLTDVGTFLYPMWGIRRFVNSPTIGDRLRANTPSVVYRTNLSCMTILTRPNQVWGISG